MREDYATDGPGRFEGEPPMVRYIHERDAYDMTSGDVESPGGWYGRAGRWVIRQDSAGFVAGTRYPTRAAAVEAFDAMDADYAAWCDADGPDPGPWQAVPGPVPPIGPAFGGIGRGL